MAGADYVKAKRLEHDLGVPHGWQGQNPWTIIHCFPHALADSWIGEGVVRSAPVGYVSIIGSIITCYTKMQVPSSLNLTQLQLCFIRVCVCVCVRVVIIQKFGEYFIYFCL